MPYSNNQAVPPQMTQMEGVPMKQQKVDIPKEEEKQQTPVEESNGQEQNLDKVDN